MVARTHDAFAFASLVTVAAIAPTTSISLLTLFVAIIANNIGALIPDMDSAGNRLWDLLPLGDHLAKVFKKIFYKHRTLSHSILGVTLIYLFLSWLFPIIFNPAYLNSNIILAATMIGIVSHLLADSITKEGIPLFFPLKLDVGLPPLRVLRIKTGSKFETLIFYPLILVFVFVLVYLNRDSLSQIVLAPQG